VKCALPVDRDPWRRDALSELLACASFRIIYASNAFTGLRLAERDRPDIIVLGRDLAKLDGPSLLLALQTCKSTQRIPVFLWNEATLGLQGQKSGTLEDRLTSGAEHRDAGQAQPPDGAVRSSSEDDRLVCSRLTTKGGGGALKDPAMLEATSRPQWPSWTITPTLPWWRFVWSMARTDTEAGRSCCRLRAGRQHRGARILHARAQLSGFQAPLPASRPRGNTRFQAAKADSVDGQNKTARFTRRVPLVIVATADVACCHR
jgi:hypothetical protein